MNISRLKLTGKKFHTSKKVKVTDEEGNFEVAENAEDVAKTLKCATSYIYTLIRNKKANNGKQTKYCGCTFEFVD